jgi:tetratricopeptide (TPR) repeat protein
MSETRRLGGDALALLEEERDFLLRSLDDLDAEFEAGDVDEADYRALRDDYTRRAAGVLRAIEARQVRVAPPRRRSRVRLVAVVAALAVLGLAAGLLLGRATGGRGGGELTGGIRASTRTLLVEAQQAFAEGEPARARSLYDEALALAPANTEALAYRGWLSYRVDGDAVAARADLDEAVAVDPAYPDARVFRASILLDGGDAAAAAADLAAYDAIEGRPPIADQLLASFRLRERVALARVEPVVLAGRSPAAAGLTVEDLRLAAEQLLEQGRFEDALVVLDAGLAVEPDDPGLIAVLGWIDGLVGRNAAAEAAQQELLLGRALDRLGRAVTLDPELAAPRVYRAILLSQLGREDDAVADLAVVCAAPRAPKLQEYLTAAGLACP